MADWLSKRHDTKRVLETNLGPEGLLTARLTATLTEAQAGTSGAAVTCIVKAAAAPNGTTPGTGPAKVNAAAVVVNPTTGHLRYSPIAADVDTSGSYLVEWEVKGADGKIDTYPTGGYNTWQIVDDLDSAP